MPEPTDHRAQAETFLDAADENRPDSYGGLVEQHLDAITCALIGIGHALGEIRRQLAAAAQHDNEQAQFSSRFWNDDDPNAAEQPDGTIRAIRPIREGETLTLAASHEQPTAWAAEDIPAGSRVVYGQDGQVALVHPAFRPATAEADPEDDEDHPSHQRPRAAEQDASEVDDDTVETPKATGDVIDQVKGSLAAFCSVTWDKLADDWAHAGRHVCTLLRDVAHETHLCRCEAVHRRGPSGARDWIAADPIADERLGRRFNEAGALLRDDA